jgi:GTP cyclohydrolase II
MFLEDTSLVAVDRCVFELRQGRCIVITGEDTTLLLRGLEPDGERGRQVMEVVAPGGVELLLNGYRAMALGLGNAALSLAAAKDVPSRTLERLGSGRPTEEDIALARARARAIPDDDAARAAFDLARLAETVPALLAVRSGPNAAGAFAGLMDRRSVLAASTRAVETFRRANAASVRRLADAPVPLPQSDDVRFVAYRSRDSLADHIAVVIGAPAPGTAPLVRLHSACLTGDIFRSLRCDCGEQLDTAIAAMSEAGGGVICYLAQEGRGIGIANKLRAYALQNGGLDTLEANEALGFAADEREFAIAARMLQDLGFERVRLMTNNPEKIARLAHSGIEVIERVGLTATLNPHNERYIEARVAKSGYLHAVNG